MYRCLSFLVRQLRRMHLRLTVILRGDARSAMAQENTSHAVTRPRMVAELVVAFTDPRELLVLWSSSVAVIGWRNLFSD